MPTNFNNFFAAGLGTSSTVSFNLAPKALIETPSTQEYNLAPKAMIETASTLEFNLIPRAVIDTPVETAFNLIPRAIIETHLRCGPFTLAEAIESGVVAYWPLDNDPVVNLITGVPGGAPAPGLRESATSGGKYCNVSNAITGATHFDTNQSIVADPLNQNELFLGADVAPITGDWSIGLRHQALAKTGNAWSHLLQAGALNFYYRFQGPNDALASNADFDAQVIQYGFALPGNFPTAINVNNPTTATLKQWHRVVFNYSYQTASINLWIDGVLVEERQVTAPPSDLPIGGSANDWIVHPQITTQSKAYGCVDDIVVIDRRQTAETISHLTQGNWPFVDALSDIAGDYEVCTSSVGIVSGDYQVCTGSTIAGNYEVCTRYSVPVAGNFEVCTEHSGGSLAGNYEVCTTSLATVAGDYEVCTALDAANTAAGNFEVCSTVVSDCLSVQTDQPTVWFEGVEQKVEAYSIFHGEGEPYWSAQVNWLDSASFKRIGVLDEMQIDFEGQVFDFVVEKKKRSVPDVTDERMQVYLKSPTLLQDVPFGDVLTLLIDQPILAKAAVEQVLEKVPEWNLIDWQIPANLIGGENVARTRLAAQIVDGAGGVLEATPGGDFLVRHKRNVLPRDYNRSVPDKSLHAVDDILRLSESYDPKEYFDAVKIVCQTDDVAFRDRVECDHDEDDPARIDIRVYLSPDRPQEEWRLSSVEPGVVLISRGRQQITREENITFLGEPVDVTYPITTLTSVNWHGAPLSGLTFEAGSTTISATDPRCVGYATVTYTTSAYVFNAYYNGDEEVLFYVEDLTAV